MLQPSHPAAARRCRRGDRPDVPPNVKYAATQADLIAALGDDNTTVVLNNIILLESSTTVGTVATGIVIENAKGVVIDGARRRVRDRRARQNDLPIRAEQRRGAHRHHRDKWIFG